MSATPAVADPLAPLREQYGLSYQIDYAFAAEAAIGLRGKRVLEVGGTLPERFVREHLGVAQWIGIEAREALVEEYKLTVTPAPQHAAARRLRELTDPTSLAPFEVLDGFIEELPLALEGQFDAIFSIATFEHILRFPTALDCMFRALRPGGKLYSRFSPIWPSHDGHHLPPIVDKRGQRFDCAKSPIPPWGHLLMRPPELHQYLLQFTDAETAGAMVFFTHHSSVLNRLFVEDYIAYVKTSRFKVDAFQLSYEANIPPALQRELERLHPGRKHFAHNGIVLTLSRPE